MFISSIRSSSVKEFKSLNRFTKLNSFDFNSKFSKIFQVEDFGYTPLEYSPLTINGRNGYFVSVYKLRK